MTQFDAEKAFSDVTYWYPENVLNKRGKYALVSEKNSSVMRYVWHGSLLPTTVDDYAKMLNVPQLLIATEIQDEMQEIVQIFAAIKKDSIPFRDKTWPSLVELAGKVYDYATKAGGTEQRSYYSNMLDWVRQCGQESHKRYPDQEVLDDLLSSIADMCSIQMNAIDSLKKRSEGMRNTLSDFQSKLAKHNNLLDGVIGRIGDKLNSGSSKEKDLKDKIKEHKECLEKEMKEYDEDVKIAATTPTYGLFGLVAAATAAGIYGKRASQLKMHIKNLKHLIEEEGKELRAILCLETHFQDMKLNVDGLCEEVQGAISDLQEQEAVWEGIRSRLDGLWRMVDKLKGNVQPVLFDRAALKNVARSWDELAKEVDEYRLNAFVCPPPEIKSVDQYLSDLQQIF